MGAATEKRNLRVGCCTEVKLKGQTPIYILTFHS
ncbi:hypothetical protein F442_09003 [Phytophthora nicotianae P10297]|uniref:Uncharacterized protein n=1 Tax=Phytophthora nicotianae P10297 TaxID=1317064 RepID=W2ZBM6_PHYNI|nr:hypothetical protein F442_09003 [Phytophthora nicotianae P10297]